MTEPAYPKRKFKRLGGETASGWQMYIAFQFGYATAEPSGNWIPRRWRTNPFRPGTHRHAEYERGRVAYKQDEAERPRGHLINR